MTELALSGFVLSLSLCLDLGTVNVASIRAGLRHGTLAAFLLGVGSSLGDLVYAGIAMAGAASLARFSSVRVVLWIGGSLVLSVLAIRMLRESFRPAHPLPVDPSGSDTSGSDTSGSDTAPRAKLGYIAQGMALALSSPSGILWFAAIGGGVITTTTAGGRAATPALLAFFGGFFAAGLCWGLFIAVVSGQGRRLGPRFVQVTSLASALLFFYLAIHVFLDGRATLWREPALPRV